MAFFVIVPAAATYFGAATVGASVAGALGLTGLGTAATFAIGAGTISAGFTALRGGDAEDILKSAVLSGATSYIGGTVGADIASNVRADAIMNGNLSFDVANAIGKVAGSAAVGALSAGTSSLLTGKGDPIDALVKGGLSAAMSTAVSTGIDAALKDVPGFGTPTNAGEAALQRAMKTAIGTTILSGGNPDSIKSAVLNSFVSTAGRYIGDQLKDLGSNVSSANDAFRASEREYTNNLEQQQKLIDQYNNQLSSLIEMRPKLEDAQQQYDEQYKNWISKTNNGSWEHTWHYLRSLGPQIGGRGPGSVFATSEYGRTTPTDYINAELAKTNQAASNLTKIADNYSSKYMELLGGEVTKTRTETRTETRMQWFTDGESSWQEPVNVQVEVQVPYKEKVEGALTPVKQQIESLQARSEDLAKDYTTKKDALTTSIQQFQDAEVNNASVIGKTLNNYVSASDLYRNEFGYDPTEDQLKAFADTGDIIGTVSKLVADNNNEQAAQEAGFSNYADYTAAGNVAPNDYYARREGWDDYAQKLAAQGNNYSNPQQWKTYLNEQQTAVDNGFINYKDYQSAGGIPSNDFYAQKEGWSDFSEKQQAQDFGFKTPTAWSIYTTDLQNKATAKAAGFPDYDTYQQYGGNFEAYQTAIAPPVVEPEPAPVLTPEEDAEIEETVALPEVVTTPSSVPSIEPEPTQEPAAEPAPDVVKQLEDAGLTEEVPSTEEPTVPVVQGPMGPMTEDQIKRYNDEFAKYLDFLQAGQPLPPDYGVQDLGITDENWDSFNRNLSTMLEEGRLPSQWQVDAEGNYTFVSDDGSTLTIGPEGQIVHYTEAPEGNLPGEVPPLAPPPATPPTPPIAPPATPPVAPPAVQPPVVRPPSPAPATAAQSGMDVNGLLALLGLMGESQAQPQTPAPEYAKTLEFDVTKAFSPTLYEEEQKQENPYLRGLI